MSDRGEVKVVKSWGPRITASMTTELNLLKYAGYIGVEPRVISHQYRSQSEVMRFIKPSQTLSNII